MRHSSSPSVPSHARRGKIPPHPQGEAFMRIGVPAEVRAGETRVAATPETVKRLAAKNEVRIQAGAGAGSSIRDADFPAARAQGVGSAAGAYDAQIVLEKRAPTHAGIE